MYRINKGTIRDETELRMLNKRARTPVLIFEDSEEYKNKPVILDESTLIALNKRARMPVLIFEDSEEYKSTAKCRSNKVSLEKKLQKIDKIISLIKESKQNTFNDQNILKDNSIEAINKKLKTIKANKRIYFEEISNAFNEQQLVWLLNPKLREFYEWLKKSDLKIAKTKPLAFKFKETLEAIYHKLLGIEKNENTPVCQEDDIEDFIKEIDDGFKNTKITAVNRYRAFKTIYNTIAHYFNDIYNYNLPYRKRNDSIPICLLNKAKEIYFSKTYEERTEAFRKDFIRIM